MNTEIGHSLVGSRWRLALTSLVGAVVVAGNFISIHARFSLSQDVVLAALAVAVYLPLLRWDRASLGLTVKPKQGWWYWCWLAALLGGVQVVATGLRLAFGLYPASERILPEQFGEEIVYSCIAAPLIEEVVFRLALCVPAVVLVRPVGAIAASAVLFSLAHIVGGVVSIGHLLVGIFLAWAYLESGSILVPVVLHSLGNLLPTGTKIGAWYWFTDV
jgi:membrane protease YdiL (CAAX protease family)